MASIFDWLTTGNNASNLLNVGTGIYDLYNRSQVQDQLNRAATSNLVDPFGANNRQFYQGQLRNLYANPNYLQNLPGYQFSLDQMMQTTNREAARAGHYLGTKRLYDLQKNAQGLASQMYGSEADRLANLSGAQFGPNAGVYSDLTQTAASGKAAQGSSILDLGKKALGLFSDASGTADAGSGGSGGNTLNKVMDTLSGFDASQYTGTPYEAAASMGSGAVDRAQALEGLGPNADLGGEFSSGYNPNNYGTLGQAGQIGAGVGGLLGAYGLTKLAGTEGNAAVATNALGGTAGTAVGAGLGSLAAGTGFGAGAGAAGGAAAGGALAGPMIPIALAAMAYGGYQENQAQSKMRKEMAPQLFGNVNWNDPTSIGGKDFYGWQAPTGEDYLLDRGSYDDLYSGDISQRYRLFAPSGEFSGMWDLNTMKFMAPEQLQAETDIRQATKAQTSDAGAARLWQQGYEGPSTPEGQQAFDAAGFGNWGTPGDNTGSINLGETTYTPELKAPGMAGYRNEN